MSKKYLTGSKRLQIINKWLRGIEDPEFDVLPTKKEGKYIVKKREKPIKVQEPEIEDAFEDPDFESDSEPIQKKKPPPKQKADPTVSDEILNQLKLLGEEMKANRKKKEQKRLIKEQIHKEISRPPPQEEPEYEEEQIQYIPVPRRRRSVFSDYY